MSGVGDRLGQYEIVARLRAGGMATLYLARRASSGGFARPAAIKVIHPHLAADPTFVRMFVDEALLTTRIDHPNVVHVYELGRARTTYYLAMEYVHGCSLQQLLRGLAREGRRLTPELAVFLAMEIAEGLHAAHETTDEAGVPLGVVHRDVSPQNVLIARRGHVKLIDFGVAKVIGRDNATAAGSLRGKLAYMAPEQAYGAAIDRRVDVYALGILLWEMLTMRRLFRSENDFALLELVRRPNATRPGTLESGIPAALDDVVMAALSPDPAGRPATAQSLRERLADAVPGALRIATSDLGRLTNALHGPAFVAELASMPERAAKLIQSVERDARAPAVGELEPAARDTAIQTLTQLAASTGDLLEATTPEPFESSLLALEPRRGPRRAAVAAGAAVAVALGAFAAVHWLPRPSTVEHPTLTAAPPSLAAPLRPTLAPLAPAPVPVPAPAPQPPTAAPRARPSVAHRARERPAAVAGSPGHGSGAIQRVRGTLIIPGRPF